MGENRRPSYYFTITGSHRHIILARLSLAVVLTVVDKGSDKGEGNRQKGCG